MSTSKQLLALNKALGSFQKGREIDDINIEVYLSNSISGTWMNMASYYGSEERFVKH